MSDSGSTLSEAFGELLDTLRAAEHKVASHEALDEQSRLEGYPWLMSVLKTGVDAYLWADTVKPHFVDIVGRFQKWGGDNADAFYQYAPIDPARTYKVTCTAGDAVYLSLTVYGGPNDGRYSTRIVGSANDRGMASAYEGAYEIWLSPQPHEGNWIALESDAVCAVTRDYLVDPVSGKRAVWQIEAVGDVPDRAPRASEQDMSRRLRALINWVREQTAMAPIIPPIEPNTIAAPYPVPTTTFGWAAGDAAYAMGRFELRDDEALVIEGRSPECAFWNLCLWNPFLHTYNYDYERVTLNGGQVNYEPDGSWRIVVSADDPGHPNWISTAGHERGLMWFRWFFPAHTPDQPVTKVVALESLR